MANEHAAEILELTRPDNCPQVPYLCDGLQAMAVDVGLIRAELETHEEWRGRIEANQAMQMLALQHIGLRLGLQTQTLSTPPAGVEVRSPSGWRVHAGPVVALVLATAITLWILMWKGTEIWSHWR